MLEARSRSYKSPTTAPGHSAAVVPGETEWKQDCCVRHKAWRCLYRRGLRHICNMRVQMSKQTSRPILETSFLKIHVWPLVAIYTFTLTNKVKGIMSCVEIIRTSLVIERSLHPAPAPARCKQPSPASTSTAQASHIHNSWFINQPHSIGSLKRSGPHRYQISLEQAWWKLLVLQYIFTGRFRLYWNGRVNSAPEVSSGDSAKAGHRQRQVLTMWLD